MTNYYADAVHAWTTDGTQPPLWLATQNAGVFWRNQAPSSVKKQVITQLTSLEVQALLQDSRKDWYENLVQYALNQKTIFDFWQTKTHDHGREHAQRVLKLSVLLSIMQQVSLKDSLILYLSAIFHDIGRTNDQIDPKHGALGTARLLNHYKITPPLTATKLKLFTKAFALQSMVLLNSQAVLPMPELNTNDSHVLLDLITYHSLPTTAAKQAFAHYNDRAQQRRFKLLALLEDADALERVRFKGNLNIDYLRTPAALRLIDQARIPYR
ncbi:HD domain-containing protein [Agrilactobacillus fermenti]|uniref:HD domain-containing protein n=1 Tax=Agrilactobacillus fermenti TaxID=2586909 RepID=UPI003A5BC3ED